MTTLVLKNNTVFSGGRNQRTDLFINLVSAGSFIDLVAFEQINDISEMTEDYFYD